MSKTATVEVDGELITVHKLALGDYAQLLKALDKLPQRFGQFLDSTDNAELQKMDTAAFVPHLPAILADSIPEFCQVLAVVSDRDAEYYEKEVGLPEAIDVLVAALEINDIKRVTESVKKLMARRPEAAKKPASAEPSPKTD